MAGPRFGVAFSVIYPHQLGPAEMPVFSAEARPGALEFLVRKAATCRLVIYAGHDLPQIDVAMHGWLFAKFRHYYSEHGLDDATGHALGALNVLDCVGPRPLDLDYDIAIWPPTWPEGSDVSAFLIKEPHPPAAQPR